MTIEIFIIHSVNYLPGVSLRIDIPTEIPTTPPSPGATRIQAEEEEDWVDVEAYTSENVAMAMAMAMR